MRNLQTIELQVIKIANIIALDIDHWMIYLHRYLFISQISY